jgi:signal transduction histidine kinase
MLPAAPVLQGKGDAQSWQHASCLQLSARYAKFNKLALEAIAKDISTPQTREAQSEKSMGRAAPPLDASETAAQTHALLRARSGFEIKQLAAEYRALRASVLRLWMDECGSEELHLDDTIRFNEAIDQALAESIGFFSAQVEQARNLFLGVLGHDLRSPLQTIEMTATYLAELHAGEKVSEAASRLIRSGAHMHGAAGRFA